MGLNLNAKLNTIFDVSFQGEEITNLFSGFCLYINT